MILAVEHTTHCMDVKDRPWNAQDACCTSQRDACTLKEMLVPLKEMLAQLKEMLAQLKEMIAHLKEMPAHLKEMPAHLKEMLTHLKEMLTHLKEMPADLKASGSQITNAHLRLARHCSGLPQSHSSPASLQFKVQGVLIALLNSMTNIGGQGREIRFCWRREYHIQSINLKMLKHLSTMPSPHCTAVTGTLYSIFSIWPRWSGIRNVSYYIIFSTYQTMVQSRFCQVWADLVNKTSVIPYLLRCSRPRCGKTAKLQSHLPKFKSRIKNFLPKITYSLRQLSWLLHLAVYRQHCLITIWK